MTPSAPTPHDCAPPKLGHARAQLVLWASFALANSVAIEIALGWLPWRRRLGVHAADLGQLLAVALALAALLELARRWGPKRPQARSALLFVVALGMCSVSVAQDLKPFVARLLGGHALALALITTALAAVVPLSAWLGRQLAESPVAGGRLRWLMVLAAWVVALSNNFVLFGGYVYLHMYLLFCAAALGGGALAGVSTGDTGNSRSRWWARSTHVAASMMAIYAIFTPDAAALVPLTNLGGAPQMKMMLRLHQAWARPGSSSPVRVGTEIAEAERAWFHTRDKAGAIAPSQPSLLVTDPIVLLVTVDAFRNDLLARPELAHRLGFFRSLDREAVRFSRAWSAAPGTAESLTSLFASRYASQLLWQRRVILRPHRDPSPRFPALLQAAGVQTVNVAPLHPLTNAIGIVRGFATEVDLESSKPDTVRYVLSADQLPKLQRYILDRAPGPFFAYVHLLDPHDPYDDADDQPAGSTFENYVQEIEVVGRRLRELRAWLEREELIACTVLIVSADHGEAFGEHGTKYHATTMYEEQLRVPLWIRVPGAAARVVNEPVSLVDLGPTVLDLMGVDTPGGYMGQSLVPFLRGASPELSRPIVADNRRKRAMIGRDGIKVIRDLRLGTLEVYDLSRDPRELNNLAGPSWTHHVRRLDAFFEAHLHRDYGSHAPFGP